MVDAVTYILENNATVQGLVGADSSGEQHKVFPVVVFQAETAPYIVVSQVSQTPGGKNCDYTYVVQVVSYANSYDVVKELNDAVVSAIINQAPDTINGIGFGFLNLTNSADGYDKEHNLYIKINTFEGMAN